MDVLQRNRTHTCKICGDGKGGLFVQNFGSKFLDLFIFLKNKTAYVTVS
jgi:hypothetical protein